MLISASNNKYITAVRKQLMWILNEDANTAVFFVIPAQITAGAAFDICISGTNIFLYSHLAEEGLESLARVYREPMSEFHVFLNNSLSTEPFRL